MDGLKDRLAGAGRALAREVFARLPRHAAILSAWLAAMNDGLQAEA